MSALHRAIQLVAHPATPAPGMRVSVGLVAARDAATLTYRVEGGAALFPPAAAGPARADGLWTTTCFELFVRPTTGNAYYEFNFSPSRCWAGYAFDGYRAGMREIDLPAPDISRRPDGLVATIALRGLPPPPWRIALAAVIEIVGGAISYWALAHPPGPPDFHHPDCFALELPAAANL